MSRTQASDTVEIFAADRITKVRELALPLAARLQEPEIRVELAHDRASLEMLRRVARNDALVDRLDIELNRLVAPTITRTYHPTATTTNISSQRSNQRGRTI